MHDRRNGSVQLVALQNQLRPNAYSKADRCTLTCYNKGELLGPDMSVDELTQAIEKLSVEERLILLERLSRSIRQDVAKLPQRPRVLNRLHGIAAHATATPTDDQVDRLRFEHLMKKHA